MPNISEAEKIAAYAHDIERAFRDKSIKEPSSFLDPFYTKYHPEKGAEIIAELLIKEKAPDDLVNKVIHLISEHETGGDEEQNNIMNADTISFFETTAQMFIEKRVPLEGYKKIKEKFDWMFNRITTNEAKELAKPFYDKWSAELEKFNK